MSFSDKSGGPGLLRNPDCTVGSQKAVRIEVVEIPVLLCPGQKPGILAGSVTGCSGLGGGS